MWAAWVQISESQYWQMTELRHGMLLKSLKMKLPLQMGWRQSHTRHFLLQFVVRSYSLETHWKELMLLTGFAFLRGLW